MFLLFFHEVGREFSERTQGATRVAEASALATGRRRDRLN
jgi:hypothetical protein